MTSNLAKKFKTCYDCQCIETSDNPIYEIFSPNGEIVEEICSECLYERNITNDRA